MRHTLAQFDDFAPDAAAVREAVLAKGFGTETGPDGLPYRGICQYEVPAWFELIAQGIGHKVIPRLACFRLNLKGELPHSWVHSDDICAKYAGVLYLTPPELCKGGTAFWHHTGLEIDALPPPEALKHADWFYAMVNLEWKDLTHWEMRDFIGMRWNRFVTYPTSRFHSRYPFEGFGADGTDGRLTWVCFYDVE